MNGDWEHRIEKIEQTTNGIQSDVKEIKLALAGSEKIGLKGFAKRVNEVESYIEKDKKQKNRIYGGFAVFVFIWGIIKLSWNYIIGLLNN